MQTRTTPSRLVWWQRDATVVAALFLLALALRLLHYQQIALHDPFFTLPSVDGKIYDEWARALIAGEGHGEGVLFLGPLYPIFMALVYQLFGASLSALKLVQAVLGAAVSIGVWGLARELFDRRVAALAGLIAALYGMLIFYGGTVMIVNLQVPLVLLLVWALVRALRTPTLGRWAACGLLLGLSALARQTTLLIAPLVALWLAFGMHGSQSFARRLGLIATFAATTLALILPFTVRNYAVADDFVLLNSTGGANFYMGNQPGADGTWQVPAIGGRYRVDNPRRMRDAFERAAEDATGHELAASEVSAYWLARGLEEIRKDPGRWLRLEVLKAGLFVNAYEVWNNRSIEVSKDFSRILRLPLATFGVIVPFGLLGIGLTLRRWRELVPVYVTLAAYLASALLFFVLARYRLPAVVLLFPFAAYAVVDLIDHVRCRNGRALSIRLVVILLLAGLVRLPLANENRMHMAYYNLGNKYRELERFDEAIDAYHVSLEWNPKAISTHNNLAVAYELAGRKQEAIEAWRRVGLMALRRGNRSRAERAERHLRALTSDAGDAPDGPSAPKDESSAVVHEDAAAAGGATAEESRGAREGAPPEPLIPAGK